MCNTSPVFKAMLTGGFKETNASEITLHGNDEFALLTILKIAHIGGKRALQKLAHCQIHEIAVVCDKYDCVGVVRPFFYLWDAPYGLMDGMLLSHAKCLSTAWTFGQKGTFSEIIELLSCTSIIQKNCLMLEGKSLKDIIPPEAYGKSNPF
jgi:hypothetical protein